MDITAKLAGITAQADAATGTPAEVDTVLAALHGLEAQYLNYLDSAVDGLHRAAGHREHTSRGWSTWYAGREYATTEMALDKARALAAAPTAFIVRDALKSYDQYTANLSEIRAAAAPFQARYNAEQWTRYFWVQNNGGHGHRTMHCSTCNRGAKRTEFGWHPELSGKTDADATAVFGENLCTVCFPGAPVAVKNKLTADHCTGSRQLPVPGTTKHYGPSRTPYGKCTGCPADADLRVMAGLYIKAHRKPAAK